MMNDELVAVLVRLDDPIHESDRGAWFLEAGFGSYVDAKNSPIFRDLDEASDWLRMRAKA